MLQTIRDKITGLVAIVFLGAIAVVFVFWGIDFQSGAASYAAEVDGERIPAETVRQAWQQRQRQLQQMLRNELPPEMQKQQQQMLLDQFVQQALLTNRARELGYNVTDEALVQRIMQYPEFQVDGQFNKDRYSALLRSAGMTEARFESDLQKELLVDQLQRAIIESAFVAPYELERRYALERQQREADYALIAAADFAPTITVTDEQIQKFYDENKSNFLLPEKVDLQYVELTRAQAESGIDVSEQELKEYYEQEKQRFESPEQRRARHILITTGDGVDDAAALKKAEDLTAKAKSGADFAQLATQNSQDPGSAQQGGDLGWAQRGMFVGPFEDAVFGMKPGEIRGPVKTQFGYHVLKLEEVQAGQIKSFDEARAEVEEEVRRGKAQSIFEDQVDKLEDQAFSALTELDSVSKSMNLPLETIEDFTREGGGEFGAEQGVIDAAFSEEVLERRQNSPLVAIGDDRAVILRVTDHTPAEPRPLVEVRAQIEAQLKTQAAREAAAKKGSDAVARLQKGEAWNDVVAAIGLKPVGKRFITRQDSVAPSAIVRSVFEAPKAAVSESKPYFVGTTTDDGNYAVLAVSQIRNADPATEQQSERNARKRRAEVQTGNEEFAAYIAEAERTADIEKNDKLFE